MTLSPAFLDELRSRTLLSALVGKSIKLQRAGREWRAPCPFHNEKTPSFYVNDDKGFYHCFGCSAHGDAIRWMTEQQGLPFMDAVKELAAAAGLDLPAPDPRQAKRAERANTLHDVMAAAEQWFSAQLQEPAGEAARAYLQQRGVSEATTRAFGLGFAPDSRGGLRSALARFETPLLVEAGLLIEVEGKEPYDRFRGRLMIPIRDARGRTIAFGGRILGAGEPKYLNSPDTPLFDKGRTLWNLHTAAPAARKVGRLIVVEGYMDAIALAGAGVAEVVAPLGTALTEAQIERLWRVVDVPILCFDGDAPGRKAAMRAAARALPLLRPGFSLAFAGLPPGQDPDDLIKAGGAAAFEKVISDAHPLDEQLWQAEHGARPLRTPEARAGLKQRLDALVETIGDPEVRRHYARDFRQRYNETFFPYRSRNEGRRGTGALPAPASSRAQVISGRGIDPIYEKPLMAGLVRHPVILSTCLETLATLRLQDPDLERLRAILVEAAFDGAVVETHDFNNICRTAGLAAVVDDLRAFNGLAFSFTRRDADEGIARRDLALAIEALAARPELEAALAAATGRVAAGGDDECWAEQVRLTQAKREADRTLTELLGYDDGV